MVLSETAQERKLPVSIFIARYRDGEEAPSEFLIPTTLFRKVDGWKDSQFK
jgi:hypothetical protein